jgi:tetratricopeptide (TPR) repeat protein
MADIYAISENFYKDAAKIADIVRHVGDFLTEHSFYRLNVHPFHPCPPPSLLMKIYADLFAGMHPFHQEAYSHQSVSRMMILPIIHIENGNNEKGLDAVLRFLRERNMTPCLYASKSSSRALMPKMLHTDRERIYVALDGGGSQEQVVRTLCAHVAFDDLLAWVNDPVKPEFPHARTIIFSEREGRIYACQGEPRSAENLTSASPASVVADVENTLARFQKVRLEYYASIVPALQETLVLNNRDEEGTRVLVQLGLECVKEKEYARALELFDEALKSPGLVDDQFTVFLSKAFCHLRVGDIPSAQAALNEAEKEDPSSAMVSYYRGHCEFELKDYIEAIDLFQKSLEMNPEHIPLGDAYFYMGLSHIEILEYDDAFAALQQAKQHYQSSELSPVLYYMGVCFFGKNDVDAAYQYFQKALSTHPKAEDLSSIHLYLGICHKEKGDFRKAIEELEKARDAEEDRLDVHNLLGFCHFKLKEHDKAIACFLRAVEIDPGSAIDWANLGVNVRAHGEDEKAIILFKKALSLDPTIGFAKKHLRELLGHGES